MGGHENKGQGFYCLQLYIPNEKTLAGAISRLFKGHFIFLDYGLGFLDHYFYYRDRADVAFRSNEGQQYGVL